MNIKKKVETITDTKTRRKMIELSPCPLSINKQCELLGIHRSGYYYKPKGESKETLDLMLEIDKIYLKYPFIGV